MNAAKPDRPNILFILSDQHRRESTGCYGNEQVKTPYLDQMADEGVKFEHCWSASPVCSPYRCTLQTGLYAHQHGMVHNNLYLDQRIPTLADWMKQAGYSTTYLGKSHWWGPDKPGYVDPQGRCRWENWNGHNRGHFHYDAPLFDDHGELTHAYEGRYDAAVYTDLAIQAMDQSHEDQPWCIQLNIGQPHTQTMTQFYDQPDIRDRMKQMNKDMGLNIEDSYFDRIGEDWFPQALVGPHVPEQYLDMYPLEKLILAPNVHEETKAVARLMLREYYAMITSVDDQVGRIMNHLKDTGQDKNTIVIYTSDHGDFVGSLGRGRKKAQPYQSAARVPLIIWGHESIAAGRVIDGPVTSVDLLPSLIEYTGQHIDEDSGPWTYQHQTTKDRETAISDEPFQCGSNFLRGQSFAALTQHAYHGSLHTQEDILFLLGSWRALFDGRWLYAVDIEGNAVKPRHLIDVANDAYDLENLLETESAETTRMHTRLNERLNAENDQQWMRCA